MYLCLSNVDEGVELMHLGPCIQYRNELPSMTPMRIIKTGTKLLSVVSLDYHGGKYCIMWVLTDNSQEKCIFEMAAFVCVSSW